MHAPKLLLLGICLDFYPSLLYVSFTDLSCDAGTNAVLKLKSYFDYSSVIILFILVECILCGNTLFGRWRAVNLYRYIFHV